MLDCRAPREANLLEVARMDAQQRSGPLAQRIAIVVEIGPVGGADLSESRLRGLEDVRNAEAIADLHQLAARDNHFPVAGEFVQYEEDRSGVVVDYQRRSAEQAFQQRTAMPVAPAPPPLLDVVFEVAVSACDRADRFHRGLTERGSAKIGVQDHTGGVDDRPQAAIAQALDQTVHLGCHRPQRIPKGLRRIGEQRFAKLPDRFPHEVRHALARQSI